MSKPVFILLVTLALAVVAVKAEWQLEDRDELDKAILNTLKLQHGEDIVPCLSIIKRDSKLSDNAFSERLVQLATAMTNGESASFRSVAISVLGDFGTTNALNFLESEVRRGNIGAISEYGAISGYDDTFWRLATLMTSDLGKPNYRCRFTVYCAMRPILKDETYYGRPINSMAKERAKSFLVSAAHRDRTWTEFIDQILCVAVPEYNTSTTRIKVIQTVLSDSNATSEAVAHYHAAMKKLNEVPMNVPQIKEANSKLKWLSLFIGIATSLSLVCVFARRHRRLHANRNPVHQ